MRFFCLLGFCLPIFFIACTPTSLPSDASGSVGRSDHGALRNGVQMTTGPEITVLEPGKAWGTQELTSILQMAAQKMREAYPDTVPLVVGHLSAENGGLLRGHVSHQSGRDVDVALYAKNNKFIRGFAKMNAELLDVDKTWYLLETLLDTGRMKYIFLDWDVQKLIYEEIKIAVPEDVLEQYFQYPRPKGFKKCIIQHLPNHQNHLHIRIHCPKEDKYCIE